MALFEVIRKKKDDANIVWRYPKRNFNTGSKLLVNESEEALFYSMGKALDLFGPGKYVLETNNIPLLRNIVNIPTGGKTPFTCDIYFIDKTEQAFKWGTSTKLEFLEPIYNFPIAIGACGEVKFKIDDSRKLLIKLVGIKANFDSENIDEFFTSQILVKVKTYLSTIIKEDKISIFEIDSKLLEISMKIQKELINDFNEFGISLDKFLITNIAKPENDKQYLQFKELYFKSGVLVHNAEIDKKISLIESEKESAKMAIEAQGMANKREIEGYTYQEEKEYGIGSDVAKNNAVGQFTNMGIGLGVMSGVGTSMGSTVSKQVVGAFSNGEIVCPNCSTVNNDSKFCKKCGAQLNAKAICLNCGRQLDNDTIFCPNCGKKVEK